MNVSQPSRQADLLPLPKERCFFGMWSTAMTAVLVKRGDTVAYQSAGNVCTTSQEVCNSTEPS